MLPPRRFYIRWSQNPYFLLVGAVDLSHGLMNNIYTKAKYRRHLKEFTAVKGLLRQVFIRVHRLVMQLVILVFSTQLCELIPLLPSLWLASPSPSLCGKVYSIHVYSM